ncbi:MULTISPECIES: hypothetical protein [unclassified Adlercreutzia]|uniref:hypothetical protein n=1 Tax=unclassified Adlercreutzia TaxID=2636013 RepID=UPI0013E9A65A|nr:MULTISPECIES: hypothetical protein [unclassified Adlercreutzia]
MSRYFRNFITVFFSLACVLALAGCTMPQQANNQTDAVAKNRQYMSALNQMSDDLSQRLDGFADAVSRNDTVGMRTQADDAFQLIDKMKEQEAPEDLVELKDGYMQACESLEDALNSYISLYEDVSAVGSSFDYSTYSDRIKEVQESYDKAASLLDETDQKAAELQK